MKSCQF